MLFKKMLALIKERNPFKAFFSLCKRLSDCLRGYVKGVLLIKGKMGKAGNQSQIYRNTCL